MGEGTMKTINEMYHSLTDKSKLAIAAGIVTVAGAMGGLVGYAIGERAGYKRCDNERFLEWLGEDHSFEQEVAKEMKALYRFEKQIDGLTNKLKEHSKALNTLSGGQSFEQWAKGSE